MGRRPTATTRPRTFPGGRGRRPPRRPTRRGTPTTTATNRAGKPIRIDEGPGTIAIAITRDGKTAYVTNSVAGTVMPIATATNTPGKPIKVGRRPFALVIAPDSHGAGHH